MQGLPRIAAEGCNVVDATTGDPPRHLLGASFVGPGVAELWHAVPAFPRSAKSGCGYWKLTATPWTPRPLASLVDERLPALGAA